MESMQSRWWAWSPAGVQMDSGLNFGWVPTNEKNWKKWWMNSRNPPGVCQSPSGVQPEYVGECKVLASTENTEAMQLYLNTALYIKVGQKLWVDCQLSNSVMNGTYHLHAYTSGWANYFNDTYGNDCITLSHRQVWAAFVQESI